MRSIAYVFLILLSANSYAFAECRAIGPVLLPHLNANHTITVTTDRNCGFGYALPGESLLKSLSLVSKPKVGLAGKAGEFQAAYIIKKGYVGKDSFSVKLCAEYKRQTGCSIITYDITVK